jgi:hypothetical protein
MNKKKPSTTTVKKAKIEPITFGIAKIELCQFVNNIPPTFAPKNEDKVRFNLTIKLSDEGDKKTLKISVTSVILVNEVEMTNVVVDSHFAIKNLLSYIVDRKFVDKGFIKYLAEVSVGHLRGMQAELLHQTPLNKIFLPMFDLTNISNENIEST